MRKAVRLVCELIDVQLTPDRVDRLERGNASELEDLLTALRRDRHWPE